MANVRWHLFVAAVLLLWVQSGQPASAQEALTGDTPPNGGFAVVHWAGGSIDDLIGAAAQRECDLSSVWVSLDGQFVGYIVGAAEFVNSEWATRVGLELEAWPLLIVCATRGLGECTYSSTFTEYAPSASGYDTTREALERGIQEFADILPSGRFVESEVSDAGAVWELVAFDGAVVGEFVIEQRSGGGWLLSSSTYCHVEP